MDTLQVDLEITDDQADVVLNRAQHKIEDFAKKVEGVNPSLGRRMGVDLQIAERRADVVSRKLNQVANARIENGQFDRLTRSAIRFENKAADLNAKLRDLRNQMASTSNRSILGQLESEAKSLEAELKRVGQAQSAISGASPASGGSGGHGSLLQNGRLQGIGQLIRSTPLYNYGIDETVINAAIQLAKSTGLIASAETAAAAAATTNATATAATAASAGAAATAETEMAVGAGVTAVAATEAAAATTVTAAAAGTAAVSFGAMAAVILPLAAVGYILYDLTRQTRDAAEQRKKVEEAIAGAYGRQHTYLKGITDELAKQRSDANVNRQFDTFQSGLGGQSIEQLQQRKKELEEILKNPAPSVYNPESKQFELSLSQQEERKKKSLELIAIEDAVYKKQQEQAQAVSNSIEQYNKIEKQGQEAAIKSTELGISKVKELKSNWDSAFNSLYSRANADNPFALFLAKSASESDKLKESLRGLPPELQRTALAMRAIADSKELFGLRLTNALNVANLRNEAANFQNPTDPSKDKRTEDQYLARFLHDHPNFLAIESREYNQERLINPLTSIESFGERIRKKILDPAKLSGVLDTAETRQNRFLEDQYNIIYDRQRKDFDIATADRKFNELTRGANPLNLSDGLRRAAVDSRLNEAARAEKSEQDAQAERKKQTEIQTKLLETQQKLLAVAEGQGLKGVEALITVKDETGGRATSRTGKRATQEDTRDYYQGDGLYNGSNL
jgi:hypothetical protein